MGEYRCVAASLEGFVQQLAVAYLTHGYWFYVRGRVPEGKDPATVDRKLVALYGVNVSKWTRTRRKRAGLASVQYLRLGREFVLVATRGEHAFFEREAGQVRDARRTPIRIAGYAVSFRGGHAHVRLTNHAYAALKADLLRRGAVRDAARAARAFAGAAYEPYAPVRRQLLNILRAVNRARRARGFEELGYGVLRLRRRVVRPFESGGVGGVATGVEEARTPAGLRGGAPRVDPTGP